MTRPDHVDRQTEEMICALQAQVNAQRIALRALFRTCADPQALVRAWSAAAVEAETCSPVAPAHERNSDYLAEEISACMDDITAELVELAVPAPSDPYSTAGIRPADPTAPDVFVGSGARGQPRP